MKKYMLQSILTVATVALLAGCQNVKREIGMGRNSPDEFLVVKRAPLSLPPDFELRAPAPGEMPPASASSDQAKTVVFGQTTVLNTTTAGENTLLNKMAANQADPAIRSTINREAGYMEIKDKAVVDRLIFWKDGTTNMDDNASVVNAAEEKKRLEQNRAEGKPVNAGDVPVIKRKTGTIDRLL